jgi:hypothetical protein
MTTARDFVHTKACAGEHETSTTGDYVKLASRS